MRHFVTFVSILIAVASSGCGATRGDAGVQGRSTAEAELSYRRFTLDHFEGQIGALNLRGAEMREVMVRWWRLVKIAPSHWSLCVVMVG